MRRLILAAATAGLIVGCASPPGRDALAMRATVFGHVAPPAGSVLVSERYEPPEQSIDVSHSSIYTRTFATNTPDQFAQAMAATGRAAGYRLQAGFDHAAINTGPGWMGTPAASGEGVGVALQFLDIEASDWRSYGHVVDATVWRYVVVMQISDGEAR